MGEQGGGRGVARGGVVAFGVGVGGTLAFFGFWPGLPHVIDWGAVLVALGVGGLARWGWVRWGGRVGSGRE